jgi:6-pyruvoyl-tetrahydropterin synthase
MGMVVDFAVLDELVGGWIDANWDHTVLLDAADLEPEVVQIRALNAKMGRPAFDLPGPPTAERVAGELAAMALTLLADWPLVLVERVTVWETPRASADWTRKGPPNAAD